MNIAIYREIEVRVEHLPNEFVRVELRLPSRAITLECRCEAVALDKAKALIDKHYLEMPDSATD